MDCTGIALCDACNVGGTSAIAEKFCFECKQKLCTECQMLHTRFPAMRDHRIVNLNEVTVSMLENEPTNSVLFRCDSHEKKSVTYFCYDHKEVYCNLCRAVKHVNCNERPIADVCGKLGANDLTHIVENLDQLAGGLDNARQERQKQVDEMISMRNQCVEEIWDLRQRLQILYTQIDNNAHQSVAEVDRRVEEFADTAALYDDAMLHVLSLLGQIKELVNGCDRETIFAAKTKAQKLRTEYTDLVEHYKTDLTPIKMAFKQDAHVVEMLSTFESLGEVSDQISEANTSTHANPMARGAPQACNMPATTPLVTARIAPIKTATRFPSTQMPGENVQPQITARIAPTCSSEMREMAHSSSSGTDDVFSLENLNSVLPLPVAHTLKPLRSIPSATRAPETEPHASLSPVDSSDLRSLSAPQVPSTDHVENRSMAPSLFSEIVASSRRQDRPTAKVANMQLATRPSPANSPDINNQASPRDSPIPDNNWRNIQSTESTNSNSSAPVPLFSQILRMGAKRPDVKSERSNSSSSGTSSKLARTDRKGFNDMVLKRQQRISIGLDNDKGVCDTTGLTFLTSGHIIICDHYNMTVKAFDANFKFVSCKRLFNNPWDATAFDTDEVAVTLTKGKKVQYLTLESDGLALSGSFLTKQMCWGIAAFREYLLITFHDSPGNGAVELRSRKGEVLNRIPDESDKSSLFVAPIYIALDSAKEKCYVTDGKNNSVVMIDCTGSGGAEVLIKKDYLKWPKGIVIDEDSRMIVSAHFANQLKLLQGKGQWKHWQGACAELCEIKRPQALAFNWQTLTLVVGNCEDKEVDVLTFEYK